MRTTIRLADDHRDTLLSLAQTRGERGVSGVIQEAVGFYLAERNKPAPVPAPIPPPPGPWARFGAELDRKVGARPGLLALVGALMRNGLSRLRLSRVSRA